jgi:hypothetical protein
MVHSTMPRARRVRGGWRDALAQHARRLADEATTAWDLPHRAVAAILLAPFAIMLAGGLSALLGKGTYKWVTGEDGVAETLQVMFYALSLLLAVGIVGRLLRGGRQGIACLYALLALGLFFLVGEELAWGQRIFGWSTPEPLEAINKQGETTLHNIEGVGYAFKWAQLLVGAYGAVLPVLLPWWIDGSAAWARARGFLAFVVPHFTLIPCFAFMFVWRLYRNLFEEPTTYYFVISEYNEIVELVLALGFLLFVTFQWRRLRAGRATLV